MEQLESRRVLATLLAIAPTAAVKPEGNSGTTPFTFTITRSDDTTGTSSVQFAVTGSGANPANNADFGGTLPSGTVSFIAGETTRTITIDVSGDTAIEPDEGFTVTLSNPIGATITTPTATGTIQDDDGGGSTSFAIAALNASRAEGNSGTTPFTFTVTRSGVTTGTGSVNFAVTGSGTNPANNADFGGTLPSGTVSFIAGEITRTITIDVSGDTAVEPAEGFTVTISSPVGGTITTPTATGTIQDDDGGGSTSFAIAALNASRAEGNSGTTPFTFTVTRSGVTTGTGSVNFAVTGSGTNPANNADFGGTLPSGTVSFIAGETTRTITIDVSGDTAVEPEEGFTVTISNPTGGTISTPTATGTIQDDDGGGSTSFAIAALNASRAEGNSGTTPFTFTVTRSGVTTGTGSVNFAVTGSGTNPANNADFGGTLPSGTVSFIAGETTRTITIDVSGDTAVEPEEGFTVTISNPTGGTISTPTATGTIQDDDGGGSTSFAIAALNASRAEGNSGTTPFTFTVTRSGVTTGTGSVNFAVTGSGANPANNADFGGTLPSGTVSFIAGETTRTITIDVSGDTAVEPEEGFTVTISNPTGGTISTPTATGTIQDDDGGGSTSFAIAALNASRAEGNSGTTPFTFTVTRSGVTTGTGSVNFAVTGSGANPANNADFGGTLPSGTVSFIAGETTRTITIDVSGDTAVEPEEGFTVTISNPTGGTISTPTATGTIQDDDGGGSTSFAIAALNASRAEGNSGTTPFTFTVTRSGVTTGTGSVNFAVTGSGANPANNADFGGTLPSGTVSFIAGETTRTITIDVSGDTAVEPEEGFTVTISNPTGGTISTPTATGTIQDDDGGGSTSFAIAALNASRAEGNSGTTPFTFTVTRSGVTTGTGSVNFAVTGSGTNPANNADFGGTLPSGTVSFIAGETTRTITIDVSGDTAVEPEEGFTVTISNPTGGTISTPTATGTIQDDDGGGSTSFAIAALNASRAEGNSGTTPFTFTVTRSGVTTGTGSVNFAVTGSGANPANNADFGGTLPSGTVSFIAGETTRTITIDVSGDTAVEPEEGFTVTISNPTGGTISTPTATGTIQDDDGGGSTSFAIAALNASRAEGNSGTTPFTFTVTRSGVTTGTGSVNFAVTGSGANPANNADFGGTLPSGTVSFIAGETTRTITIDVSGDTAVEPEEGFTVTISNPTGGTISTPTATGTIQDDDGGGSTSFAIAALNASRAEGNSGTTPFTFTVTRSGVTTGTGSVNFAVTGSGANPANNADFGGTLPSGTVSFIAGETTRTITIDVSGDTAVEPEEGFTVTISSPVGGTISTPTATGTIQDDDGGGSTSFAIAALNASRAEGNSGTTPFTFTVTRSGVTTGTGSVNFAVTGSGANPANNADFGGTLPSGTVSFIAGETTRTITIDVSGDTAVEPEEGFTVTISNPTGGTISTPTATGTIQDDDGGGSTSFAIAALNASRAEGNSGTTPFTFTVTRSGVTTGTGSVNFAVTGSGANPANNADFGGTLPSGTVSFIAGETTRTITIDVSGDTAVEPEEGFTVTISNPTGGTISTPTATGTIQDDDGGGSTSFAIAALNASRAEGNSGTTPFTFTVTRSGVTTGTGSVNFAVTGSGANPANNADFGGTLPSGTVSFIAGETTRTITIDVSGDTAVEPEEGFTVTISNPTGGTISTPTATGTIQDDDDTTEPGGGTEIVTENVPGAPGTAELVDDADNPGQGAVVVTGTAGSDLITVLAIGRSQIWVLRNGRRIGSFHSSDVQHFVVFAMSGNDTIILSPLFSQPATIFGDAGNDSLMSGRGADGLDGGTGNDRILANSGSDQIVGGDGNDTIFAGSGNDLVFGLAGKDRLYGEAGNDVVVGGEGNDWLSGGSGRDLLLGGAGLDSLFGDSHDDLLVSGSTVHDEDLEALAAILAEWASNGSYATRTDNIRTGGGAASGFALEDSTVIDDGVADSVWGLSGQDWFLSASGDRLRDKARSELVN